jgi:hypothetical protein
MQLQQPMPIPTGGMKLLDKDETLTDWEILEDVQRVCPSSSQCGEEQQDKAFE